VIRVALQALAAVLGGTQSLHTNALDEALALPTAETARLALRTQQIIAHETGVTDTVDPLGGSYYLEKRTNELEQGVYEYFRKLDALGGMVRAIELGYPQREIGESAYKSQQLLETQEAVIVGVNDFLSEDGVAPDILKIDQRIEKEHITKVCELRQKRDNALLQRRLQQLGEAARSEENIMPAILQAVKAYGTIGEICDVLREVWGVYKEPVA
jgi:methylmalonyl-CoA mutase N-terminal domain/subunit